MSDWTLTLASSIEHGLDLAALNPALLAGKSADAIRRLRLRNGRRTIALGDLFSVAGGVGDDHSTLALKGLTAHCHRLGFALKSGTLDVRGSAGNELGREMSDGVIRISGSAGDHLGAGMLGGCIMLGGNAGDGTGGMVAGATRGMNGGLIVIRGNAGARCGERMRRGLILIAGDAGAYTGSRMLAGTIAVLGACGAQAGCGMRRGTLLLAHAPSSMTTTFNDCGEFDLGFLPLLRDYIGAYDRRQAKRLTIFMRARRWCGDMAYGGTGELFVAAPA